jgi:hypothetical protein
VRVAWLLDAPQSPAAPAVAAHARALAAGHGFDGETATGAAPAGRFDVAVAVGVGAAEPMFRTDAARRVLLVHDLEDRRFAAGTPERAMARLALDLPVAFLATRPHVAGAIARLRPDASCHTVRLGVDAPGGELAREPDAAALRVHAADATARDVLAAAGAAAWRPAASAADADVVLALEPPADPTAPIAALHAGATCVAAEAPALAEVLDHGVNGLLCEPGDTRGPLRQLELLARDRALLASLREGARATARAWPTVEQAAGEIAAALREITGAEPPDPAPAAAAMLAGLRGTLEEHRAVLAERDALARRLEPLERFASNPLVRRVLARRRG